MIRLIAGTAFLWVATSVQAMTPAPIPRQDGMISQVAFGCGVGQTLVNGECVARATIRRARREAYGVGAGAPYDAQAYYEPPVADQYAPWGQQMLCTYQGGPKAGNWTCSDALNYRP
jgi:hypothetical protein